MFRKLLDIVFMAGILYWAYWTVTNGNVKSEPSPLSAPRVDWREATEIGPYEFERRWRWYQERLDHERRIRPSVSPHLSRVWT